MIDHIGFEVSDLQRSAHFYDAVFYALGARRMHSGDFGIAWGVNGPTFWITSRSAPAPAYGHIALAATGKAAVRAAYAAGMANGGSSDGEPSARPAYGPNYYSAYLRDPDKLRVELVCGSR